MEKYYEKYMFFIGIVGSLIFYLQAFKIFHEHNAAAVSLPAFMVGFISVASWMIYAVLIKNRALFVSNLLATIGALLAVLGIIFYKFF